MPVRKVSVSLPDEVAASALESALRKGIGLSAWLTEAAQAQLRTEQVHDEGLRAARELVLEYESEHGAIPPEADAWASSVLESAFGAPGAGRSEAAGPLP